MTRTLMAHSLGLTRTIIMVPTGHLMHNSPGGWLELRLARTIFHGPKPVRDIEVSKGAKIRNRYNQVQHLLSY